MMCRLLVSATPDWGVKSFAFVTLPTHPAPNRNSRESLDPCGGTSLRLAQD
jgi:hypothetical protein